MQAWAGKCPMHCCGSHFLRTTFNYFHTFYFGWIFEHCWFVHWHSVQVWRIKNPFENDWLPQSLTVKITHQAHILARCQKFKFRPVQNRAYNLNRFEFMPMPSSWKTIFINSCIARTAKKVNDSYIISFTIRFLSCRWWCGQTCHFSSCICRFKIVISCIRNCNLIAP